MENHIYSKWSTLSILYVMLLSIVLSLTWNQPTQAAQYKYVSPEGIIFETNSAPWASKAMLESLYQELLRDAHGPELKMLKEVYVHDQYVRGQGTAGEYEFHYTTSVLGKTTMQPGTIHLYGGGTRKTVKSMARTLAHEYGHHVTHFYTIQQDGFALTDPLRWKDSTYARLRRVDAFPQIGVENVEHEWNIAELAAEDYVQLFGSPLAHTVTVVPSRIDQIQQQRQVSPFRWDGSMYNVVPQENFHVPLASQVPGLYQWLAPKLNAPKNISIPANPDLQVAKVIHSSVGYEVQFTWKEKDAANLVYTLITYKDGDSLPEPIVTRKQGQPLVASYGSVSVQKGNQILTFKDPNATGVRHFRVYAQNQKGVVSSSPILTIDMSNPSKATVTTLSIPEGSAPVSSNTTQAASITNSNPINGLSRMILVLFNMLFERLIEGAQWIFHLLTDVGRSLPRK